MKKIIFLLLITTSLYSYPMHCETTFEAQEYVTRVSLTRWIVIYLLDDEGNAFMDYTNLPGEKTYVAMTNDDIMELLDFLLTDFNEYVYPCKYSIQNYEVHLHWENYTEIVSIPYIKECVKNHVSSLDLYYGTK